MLPCARITSIRFKGTFSVERSGAGSEALNTPSEGRADEPRSAIDYGSGEGADARSDARFQLRNQVVASTAAVGGARRVDVLLMSRGRRIAPARDPRDWP